ncbi:type II toxin-antitoxin system RelE/ParE family toxin [Lentisphaera profundi]|uniref:Type II toxin-antitoxin system RelE/ParE family toxin n=1 Tax=Lentisphaera profundi TaxID=1658616 RepID=A0ABY7VV73_9BACT|nr:type II toxin-antitoxin system RelE/ParE family toxin [Lentisphaera profundi]WDE97967.1 type II toxin-antitoxin system RelE/ParE family toxin [Lentisphaera profundi]
MSYTLVLSKQAEVDLLDVLQYTFDSFGERQYWIYRDLIKETIALITETPLHVASRSRHELAADARTYHISNPKSRASHFLLYRINENEQQIELGRILHETVDIERQLPTNFE